MLDKSGFVFFRQQPHLPCSQFEAAFNSVLHDEALIDPLIDQTIATARATLTEIARG